MSDNIDSVSYNNDHSLFPEEVFVYILFRVPVKSLVRFKSVCKQWRNLINDPRFLANHLLPSHHDRNLVLYKGHIRSNHDYVFSLLSGRDPARRSQPRPLPELPRDDLVGHIHILGPINGMMCLFHDSYGTDHCIVLWRPSDGEIKVLPPSDAPNPPEVPHEAKIDSPNVGFGYDFESNDYKVVRISMLVLYYADMEDGYEDETGEELWGHKYEVYCFNTNSWKLKTYPDIFNFHIANNDNVSFVNDKFLWWAHDQIVWFGVRDETLGTIMPPDETDVRKMKPGYGSSSHCRELFVFNDRNFGLVVYNRHRAKKKWVDVWVLLEFGVQESWTKLFTIGPLERVNRPLFLWKADKIILENTDGDLILCDYFTNEMENLNIRGARDDNSHIISIEDKYMSW